jgi:hypothetical protein
MWTSLLPGDIVTLSQGGLSCHEGRVDDRSEEGKFIWVTDGIGHRRLFHIDDDYDLEVSSNVSPRETWRR